MIYVAISILILLFAIGYYFMRMSFYPKVLSYETLYDDEVKRGMINHGAYEQIDKEDISIKSENGYELHGVWIPVKDSKKAVILVHGYCNNLNGSIRYMSIFREKGFHVFMYDQRYHGRSGGKNCTFGYHEKSDLSDVVDWVEKKVGSDAVIGLHGESMGASTVLMHAAIDRRASFIISDCAFSDLNLQYSHRVNEDFHLPPLPILTLSNIITRLFTGVSYGKVSPIHDVKKITAPICYIHGKADCFTNVYQTIELYNETKGVKKLYLADEADHAQSILVDTKKYSEVIHEFLDSI